MTDYKDADFPIDGTMLLTYQWYLGSTNVMWRCYNCKPSLTGLMYIVSPWETRRVLINSLAYILFEEATACVAHSFKSYLRDI